MIRDKPHAFKSLDAGMLKTCALPISEHLGICGSEATIASGIFGMRISEHLGICGSEATIASGGFPAERE